MIMGGDKKKLAVLIAARVKGGSAEDSKKNNQEAFEQKASEPKSDMDEGLVSASEEMIAAIHSKDAHGFATALQDFISMSDKDEDAGEESEESEDVEKKHPILG